MNRHTVQTAIGRVVVRTTPTNMTTKAQCLGVAPRNLLSTTPAKRSDESSEKPPSGREKSAQAAAKLGQLVRPPLKFRRVSVSSSAEPSPSSAAPAAAAAAPRAAGGGGPVDARTLGAQAAPGPGSKVLNLRSLRSPNAPGRLGGARIGSGSASAITGGTGLGRFSNRDGGAGGARPSRFGRPGGARTGGRPGGGTSRFGARRPKPLDKKKKKENNRLNDKPVDREWSAGEMQVLDRLDQGELLPYTPKATLESLSGYGPAIATDNTLGKVESALRAMRIMGGGRAFDNEPASTVDTRAFRKRYLHEKKPIFLNTLQEKKWLQGAMRTKLTGPAETVKQAVIETVIQGKYTAPQFTDLSDVKGLVANYQSREASYRLSHCQEFTDKLVSMLPPAKAGNAAAAARK